MIYQKVDSSNIDAVAHEGNVLGVRFNSGAEYHYDNVPPELHDEIVTAASVGRSFNALIKSRPEDYPFRKVA